MRIDFHTHVTPPDIIADWEKYARKEPYFSMLCQNKYNKFAAAEDIIAAMEHDNFDKAVVFGFAFHDLGLNRYVNDYVIEKINEYPQKLIGFAVTSPGSGIRGDEAAKEIERCYHRGLRGVGELFPAGQEFNLENIEETTTVTEVCKGLSLPLLLHANEPVGHYYTGKTNVSLKQLESFVINNPDLKIILAHWGGGLLFYETMKEVSESFRNVYYDTSITPFLYDERVYKIAKALDICDKILFGSDFPILPPSRYMDAVNKSGFTEEEKEKLLGGNARRLLNI
ncbi:MAG: amidohydrolase family protein [Treponema sp.]|nr:amidohydrolase family protein [Treponema sp.]